MTTSKINYPVVLTLCACCSFNVALYVHIFPFIADFLLSIGVDEHDVGTYTGLAESLCFAAQFLFNPFWTYMVHRFPKRNLMIYSLVFASIVGCLFGLSTKVWHIVLLRIAVGGGHCLPLMPPLILGENVPKEHLAKTFAWIGTSNVLGGTIGHFIGGLLALPNDRIPILGSISLFQHKPYLLPGVTMSMISIGIIAAVVINIPKEREHVEVPESSSEVPADVSTPVPKVHWTDVFKNRKFQHLVASSCMIRLSGTGCDAWISAGGHLSPSIGGLGLSVNTLGNMLSIADSLALLTLFFIFPRLIKAISNRSIFLIIALAVVDRASYYPLANHLAAKDPHHSALFWAVTAIGVTGKPIQTMWSALSQIFMISIFPDGDLRTYSIGVQRQFVTLGSFLGTYSYGHLFTISSKGESGTITRQLSSMVAGCVACIIMGLALSQRQLTTPEKPSAGVDEESVDERTTLLGNENNRRREE